MGDIPYLSRRTALKGVSSTVLGGSVYGSTVSARANGWPDFEDIIEAMIDYAVEKVGDIEISMPYSIQSQENRSITQQRSWVKKVLQKLLGGINNINDIPVDICAALPDDWDSVNKFCAKVLQSFTPKTTNCGKVAAVKLDALTKESPSFWWGDTEIKWRLNGWLGIDTDACIYAGVDEFPGAQECSPIYCPNNRLDPTTAPARQIGEAAVDYGIGVVDGSRRNPENILLGLIAAVIIGVFLLEASAAAAAGAVILLPVAGYYALTAGRKSGNLL